MIGVAVRTARHGAGRHLGSFVATGLGVALIALVGLLIASVETYLDRLGPGEQELRTALQDTTSLLGVMAGFAGFMAIFVVASTCSFVVASRSRELGLLRLVGASPRQVKRLIRIETLVVAAAASAAGSALGLLLFPAASALLAARDLAPGGLPVPDPGLPLLVASSIGVMVAWLGGWTASRRAARVSPAAALQEADELGARTGVLRLVVGTLCLAGGAAMLLGIRAGDPLLAMILAIFVPEVWVVALICLGPLLLPPLVRVATWPVRRHPLWALARENAAARARRTTSLAAPVLALSAIAGSLMVTLAFAADWEYGIADDQLQVPLVVTTSTPDQVARLRELPGLELEPREVTSMDTLGEMGDSDVQVEGIDPALSARLRGIRAHRGDLADLTGRSVAVARSVAWDSGIKLGGMLPVRFADGRRESLRVVALVDDAATLQSDYLVPAALARKHGVRPQGTWFVRPTTVAPSMVLADWDPVAGRAQSKAAWLADRDAELREQNQIGLWAVLGPTGLYAGLAIANTLLLGSVQRRQEFRALRLVGATVRQVRRMVAAEAMAVAAVALVLGGLVTAVTGWLLRAPMTAGLGEVPLTVPWLPLAAIAATCVTVATASALGGTAALGREGTVPVAAG
ncbi:FtsX-like permease family protein [Nocardioides daejeonensis]|uniref:FtsX-like permease family protein n=1 Tax=Nocardioides daejeonensis TaxID=1046556 RepID=UPI000D74E40C|nr:ABC transporter permease [Nocardioides daejeonensis]